ncbi:uncharacterized protein LALA0_S08e03928g [Lachancea lanzarotensis]|uniref:LALA0S08e03928g1_1 n=1 Tax=Lachancea lanzarotensis TaxID=1245769 RepID=A0A0C7NAL9_9SACH|nr:uncharacterized protein LALA0_S08e03928g [Lachancea lanzarotensis]CEP63502.1 LALA0S08e03928g1_1 [Lachancea lanzarotensis]
MIFEDTEYTAISPATPGFFDLEGVDHHGGLQTQHEEQKDAPGAGTDVFELISAGSSFEASLLGADLDQSIDTQQEEPDEDEGLLDFELPLNFHHSSSTSNLETTSVPHNLEFVDHNTGVRRMSVTKRPSLASRFSESRLSDHNNNNNNNNKNLANRPQPVRRRSNPFYFPSKHIKNMISKEKQRLHTSRKTQAVGKDGSCDSSSSQGPQHNKPILERRQTVL